MLNLVKNLNLIIGPYIDENDEHWHIFILHQEILETLCSTKVTIHIPKILEIKVSEYLDLLTKKFQNCLKPKHHFLIHYPSIMQKVGPLWNITCMRFERKNREGKQLSHSAVCRINVCRSIAFRHQLILNYRFMNPTLYPTYILAFKKLISIHNLPDVEQFLDLIPKHSLNIDLLVTNSIQYMGKSIKKDSVIIIFSEMGAAFFLVNCIILINSVDFIIVSKSLIDCYFDEHLRAFKIHDLNNFHWEIISRTDLKNAAFSYVNKIRDGSFYITKNWI